MRKVLEYATQMVKLMLEIEKHHSGIFLGPIQNQLEVEKGGSFDGVGQIGWTNSV